MCSSPSNIKLSPFFKDLISIFSFSDIFKFSEIIFILSSSNEKNDLIDELFKILLPYIPFSKLNKSEITGFVMADAEI